MSNSQKPRRHASLAVRSHSSPRELHDARHGTRDEHQPECYTIDAHGPDDSTRLIAACLGLVSILLVLSYTRLRPSRVVNAADEQAVIVNIRLTSGDMGNAEEHRRIAALEEQLVAAIKEAGAGEFDGDEFGNGFCTIYMYSPSADRLFTVVQPVPKKFHAPTGSYLIKRYGKPGAKQERVEIGDKGQTK